MDAHKPKLQLTGQDGNAFLVMGLARKAAKDAGWAGDEIETYINEAMAGDYNNLLRVTMEHFDVT